MPGQRQCGYYDSRPARGTCGTRRRMLTRRLPHQWLSTCVALLAAGCATTTIAPLPADFTRADLERDERVLWQNAAEFEERLRQSDAVYVDIGVTAYLEQVTVQLLMTIGSQASDEVRPYVLADPVANAFVLPNGAFFITTGLLARLENEAQLATVIGHEVAHFLNRDNVRGRRAAEQARREAVVMNAFLLGFAASASENWQLSEMSGYSRAQEFNADAQGLAMMIDAGYDPADAERLFEHLRDGTAETNSDRGPRYASHPHLSKRVAHYRELLATGIGSRPRATGGRLNTQEYEAASDDLLLDNAEIAIERRHTVSAAHSVDRYLQRYPQSARAWFLRGEIARRGDPASPEAALHAYQHAAGLPEPPAELFKALGLVHRQRGEHELAAVSLQRYLQLEPDAVDAPIIRGFIADSG